MRSNDTISAIWTGSGFTLNTTTLADGWHELRVIAYNNDLVHTQGNARRTVIVNNSGQSVSLSGPSALAYTSNGTFTVSVTGISIVTNVTIQANGRTFASLPVSGGTTTFPASASVIKDTTLYGIAWLNNGQQVWSPPWNVAVTWTPMPPTNVAFGATIAALNDFATTTNAGFSWNTTTPTVVTNTPAT